MAYIKCPVTGAFIPTNHILSNETALLSPTDRRRAVFCEACQSSHYWTASNGFFLAPVEGALPEQSKLKKKSGL